MHKYSPDLAVGAVRLSINPRTAKMRNSKPAQTKNLIRKKPVKTGFIHMKLLGNLRELDIVRINEIASLYSHCGGFYVPQYIVYIFTINLNNTFATAQNTIPKFRYLRYLILAWS